MNLKKAKKIIFIGDSSFALIIFKKLIKNGYKPILVITNPEKPKGRKKIIQPSELKKTAQTHRIPVLNPSKIIEIKDKIKELNPDLIITASYGQIIPKTILEIPKYKSINIHPSLLPKYRGPSPIQTAIINGDQETGISIYFMDEKIDNGPIISQKKVEIKDPKITYEELKNELAEEGGNLLIKILPKIFEGKIEKKTQNFLKASYTKMIKKNDGLINWNEPAEKIERKIRAFFPWPGTFSFWEKNDKLLRIKILKAKVISSQKNKKYCPGKVVLLDKAKMAIACGKDLLEIQELQIEGKKPMTIKEFLNGYPQIIDSILK